MTGRARIAIAAALGGVVACFPEYTFRGGEASGDDAGAGPDATLDGRAGDAPGDSPSAPLDAPSADDADADADAPEMPDAPSGFDASDTVRIAPGSFTMQGVSATLTHEFLVDRYEVTVDRF